MTTSMTLSMAEQLVPDELWAAIGPLLPPQPPHPKGGPALDRRPGGAGRDHLRAARWRALATPARPGAGLRQRRNLLAAGARLAAGGVWAQLHHRLLDWLGDDG